MKKKTPTLTGLASLILCLSLALSGCAPKEDDTASAPETRTEFEIPLLDQRPEKALSVQAARETVKPGENVLVYGQIGGTLEPFYESFSGFVLTDTDVMFCDEMGNDNHCVTPWDACCEDPDKLKASRASVQFVDSSGAPFPISLEGQSGLKGLKEVVVEATVAEGSTRDNLVLNATGIYVTP